MTRANSEKKPGKPKPLGRGRESAQALRARAGRLYRGLRSLYPQAHCALRHRDPYELLVATILSAQCTDDRVNIVTPGLFRKYPDPRALAAAKQEDLEDLVRTTGFFRNKAKSLLGAGEMMTRQFGAKVPDTMEELLQLPGVARKTANVVLGNAFSKNEGVVVDTHVTRLSRRMGLTRQKDPTKIEKDLMKLFPRSQWTLVAHLFIHHGRAVCKARGPDCEHCALARDCPKVGV